MPALSSNNNTTAAKALGAAREQETIMKHSSVKRPTMYLASMDIKTAFDVAKPKHIANIMEHHDVHGRIIAAILREMAGLEVQAKFECVESTVSFAKCIRQGRVLPSIKQGRRKTAWKKECKMQARPGGEM